MGIRADSVRMFMDEKRVPVSPVMGYRFVFFSSRETCLVPAQISTKCVTSRDTTALQPAGVDLTDT